MYGLMILLGTISSLLLAENLVKKRGLDLKIFWECAFWVIALGIIGARSWHLVDSWYIYSSNPVSALYIWNGGLSIFGALAAGILTAAIYLRAKHQNILEWLDIFSVVAPLGQAIGRWGNVFNNELLPFSFYESGADVLLFGLVFVVHRQKQRIGTTTLIYLIGYLLIRLSLQPFRP